MRKIYTDPVQQEAYDRAYADTIKKVLAISALPGLEGKPHLAVAFVEAGQTVEQVRGFIAASKGEQPRRMQ